MYFIIMMTTDSIELKQRYVNGYKEYFEDFHPDQLLAMAVNPLLATRGFKDMIALMGKRAGEKLKRESKDLLRQSIRKFAQGMDTECSSTITDDSSSSEEDDFDLLTPKERLEKARLADGKQTHTSSLWDRIDHAVEEYLSVRYLFPVLLSELPNTS